MIGQCGSFDEDTLRHSQPVEAKHMISDVIMPMNPRGVPCCSILSQLETLDEAGRWPIQYAVTVVESAENSSNQ